MLQAELRERLDDVKRDKKHHNRLTSWSRIT